VALPPVPATLRVDVETEKVQVVLTGGDGVGDVGDFFEHADTTDKQINTETSERTIPPGNRA
jgi:hypothetical protein